MVAYGFTVQPIKSKREGLNKFVMENNTDSAQADATRAYVIGLKWITSFFWVVLLVNFETIAIGLSDRIRLYLTIALILTWISDLIGSFATRKWQLVLGLFFAIVVFALLGVSGIQSLDYIEFHPSVKGWVGGLGILALQYSVLNVLKLGTAKLQRSPKTLKADPL